MTFAETRARMQSLSLFASFDTTSGDIVYPAFTLIASVRRAKFYTLETVRCNSTLYIISTIVIPNAKWAAES